MHTCCRYKVTCAERTDGNMGGPVVGWMAACPPQRGIYHLHLFFPHGLPSVFRYLVTLVYDPEACIWVPVLLLLEQLFLLIRTSVPGSSTPSTLLGPSFALPRLVILFMYASSSPSSFAVPYSPCFRKIAPGYDEPAVCTPRCFAWPGPRSRQPWPAHSQSVGRAEALVTAGGSETGHAP
jgi:hypothetical protein